MASTYSTDLRIELIGAGDQPGVWGTTTNTNLGTLIEDAISGNATVSVTASPRALTALNGAVDEARQSILTLTTTLTSAFTVLAPPVTKQYVVYNNTAYTATIGNATVINGTTPTGGTTVAIPAGKTVTMWSDGANIFSSNTALPGATIVTTLIVSGTSTLAAVNSGALAVTGAISSTTGASFATSSGNVGIGTSNPSKKLEVYAASNSLQIQSVVHNDQGGSGVAAIGFNVSSGAAGDASASKAGIGLQREFAQGTGSLCFYNSASTGTADFTTSDERMRIDSSGNLLVGATTVVGASRIRAVSGSADFRFGQGVGPSTAFSAYLFCGSAVNGFAIEAPATSELAVMSFYNPNGGIGSIITSGSTTSYNTSSDYRLKEDWQPMTGASERVKALKPVNFAWKVDGSRVDGFLAHEAQEVVPECVTGVKDAVDAKGKPNYQGIDQSKLVPLLTAALQEALTKIDSLTARITALEGN